MTVLPNRFSYRTKADPDVTRCFDCVELSMSDGIMSVDKGDESEDFRLADLQWFDFSMGRNAMLAIMLVGGRRSPWPK